MSIGDLANDVARLLYEQRIAVAILSVVGVVAAAIVAWRRGWLAAAARHPRRTLAGVAVALAVTLPVGWYLGSPIFVRTSLVEAFPSAAPVAAGTPAPTPVPTPSQVAGSATPAPPTVAPTVAPTPFAPVAVSTASWQGTDDFHFASGSASIVEVEPGRYQLRLEDFSIRNGPDLYVYLSPSADGWTEDALELGLLKATDGAFGYDIPEGVDIEAFRSAIVWCKAFSHLFATAPFET